MIAAIPSTALAAGTILSPTAQVLQRWNDALRRTGPYRLPEDGLETAGLLAQYEGHTFDLSPEERLLVQTDAVRLERSVGRTRPAVFGLFSSPQGRWDRILGALDRNFPNGGGTAFLLERPEGPPPALRHRFYVPSDDSGESGVFFGTLHFAAMTLDELNRPPGRWRFLPPPADILLLGGRGTVADDRLDSVTEILRPAVVTGSATDGPRIRRRGGAAELRLDGEGEVYALVTYDPQWKRLEAAFHRFGEGGPFLKQVISLRRRERIEDLLKESYRPRILTALVRRLWEEARGGHGTERMEGAWDEGRALVGAVLPLAADYLAYLQEDPDRTREEREQRLAGLWRGLRNELGGDRRRYDEAIRVFLGFLRLWNREEPDDVI
ncbi:MAG TPA: hypothetical protein VLJ37_07430 [bacterium]|nr:hypothetical protein [bacterium]